MKELNKFRQFLSENTQSKDRMVKQIERALKDNISIFELPMATQDYYRKNKSDFLSENALGVDREDGTFEITPDIEIMGQSFNFSDICPSAHKLVKKLADENSDSPEVLNFAILHRDFFALEKKALGPQKITVDEYKNDVTRLYVNIINAADKLGVRREAKRYMDMHIGKIKDVGFKASEPGGSSDRNFEERYEPTDKELDFADEIEYLQDFKDEQDALFGKSMGSLEEQLKEVRSRLENEVKGYTDLHENDVVLEAFLGESNAERNPLRGIKNSLQSVTPGFELDFRYMDNLGYAKAVKVKGDVNIMQFFTENPQMYEAYARNIQRAKNMGVDVDLNTNILDAYNAIADAAAQYELRENLEEGPYGSKTGYQVQYRTMNNKVASFDSKIFAEEKEALDFAKSKEPDPSIMGVQVWEFYGPGETRASGTQYLGGDKEVYYYSNPVIRKKDLELSPEELDIKKFMGSPSFTHKRYGLSTDYKLMDKLRQFKDERKEFLASLDKPLEEGKESLTKSILKKHPKKYKDEKEVNAAAAKLMKDPKFKARYKGKKGVDFINYTLKTLAGEK